MLMLCEGEEVVRDGPSRPSTCPHSVGAGGACGGCDLDRWPVEVRHQALQAMVARAYRLDTAPELVPSPHDGGSRARIQLSIEGGRLGYRAPRSHDLVAIEDCELGRPELRGALAALRKVTLPEGVDRVELRSDGTRVVYAFRRAEGAGRVELPDLGDVALDGRPVHGDPTLWLPHLGRPLRASPNSFFQVHLELNRELVRFVVDHVLAASPERVLDLYSGIGNFTVPLAEAGIPVEAVELEGQATADLQATAHDLRHVVVTTLPAERFDPQRTPFDVAVLDPPRAGAKEVMDRVLQSRPRRIVHVACDPVAGARDVARAHKQGYRTVSMRLFDLFPRTHHVETVTVLERGAAAAPKRGRGRR